MIKIGAVGNILILVMVLWPLMISAVLYGLLSAYRTTNRLKFFIVNLLVGYAVYLAPNILKHGGAFNKLDTETVELIELLPFLLPIVFGIILAIVWVKKNKIADKDNG